jgi:serpin B
MRHSTWIAMTLVAVGSVAACTNAANIASQNQQGNIGGNSASTSNGTGATPSIGGTSASNDTSVGGATPTTGGSTASQASSSIGGASNATGGSTASAGSGVGGTTHATGGSTASQAGSSVGGTTNATGGSTASAGSTGVTVLRSSVSTDTNPNISDTDFAAFIDGVNTFGLELSQAYVATDGSAQSNGVFSSSSAQVAMAMLYGGAVGATATAMQSALHDQLPAGEYHIATNRMMRALQSRAYTGKDSHGNDVRIELDYANSIWSDYTIGIKTPFLDLLSRDYDSGMRRVNFIQQPEPSRIAINDWVAQKTNDKIIDLLTSADVNSSTRVVLVNALYFYGSWSTWFDPAYTSDQTFHSLAGSDVTVQTMRKTESLPYKAGSNYQVVQLPYTQGHLHFTLVLPQAGAFETVRSSVSQTFLAAATSDLSSTQVALALPKFSITTGQMNLNNALKKLGLSVIFSAPDFSGISDMSLVVNTVVQKAFIGADEFGTEAAASTAVSMSGSVPTVTPVTVDRPFLFFIQDETGLVLFSGQVVDPTKH